ncbi:MAG: rod-binding protein [Mahellales bacterium]|jgi:flagellar protein FlgJ
MRIGNDLRIGLTGVGRSYKNNAIDEKTFESLLTQQSGPKQDQELMDTCRLVEKFFLDTLMNNWGLFSVSGRYGQNSIMGQTYEDIFREEISNQIVKGRGIGLAQQLYQQLSIKK